MKRNIGIIAAVVAVGLLIVGGISFAIANYAGQPKLTAIATIYDVDYRAPRTTTSGSGDSKKTTRRSAEWKVRLKLPNGQMDTRTTSHRPPAWQKQGAKVRVQYQEGRWMKGVNVVKIEQGI